MERGKIERLVKRPSSGLRPPSEIIAFSRAIRMGEGAQRADEGTAVLDSVDGGQVLKLAQKHAANCVIGAFAEHEVGAGAGGQDVFAQVYEIDGLPDSGGRLAGLDI